MEVDFQNGGFEFAPVIRILQAYLRMDWGDVFVLGGQKWDTFSPLRPTVNDDSVMFGAGNPGLRRPQLLVGYDPKRDEGSLSVIGGIGLSGAVDGADRDFDGYSDGEESGLPHFQARVGYSYPLLGQRLNLGLSGAYRFLTTRGIPLITLPRRQDFRTRLFNVDFTVPLASFLGLRGEGWWGRNSGDFGGSPPATSFILINIPGEEEPTGRLLVRQTRGRGGWAELNIKPSRLWSLHPGFTTDDPLDRDIAERGITRNRVFYLGNRLRPGENLLIGIDYLRWKTNFKGLTRGLNNRVNVFFQYSF